MNNIPLWDTKAHDLVQIILIGVLVFQGSDKIPRGCPRIQGGVNV